METISGPFLLLAIYWAIFFRRFIKNPYQLCTSELASTFFPYWRWIGNQLRKGIFPATDDIFYKYPASIPFLSSFYPLQVLTSWVGSFFDIDSAFRLYAYSLLIHYLFGSILAFLIFSKWCNFTVALFGALTITYSGYLIKLQTPAFVYSASWFIGLFFGGWFGAISFGMSLLGGYYPILVYIFPFATFIYPLEILGGFFMALPQILTFIGYFKASIRHKASNDSKIGKLPTIETSRNFRPSYEYTPINGVHYPEMALYMGLAIFFIWFSFSRFWVCLISSLLWACGILPSIQRIPTRALYLFTISMSILATDGLQRLEINALPILILQGYLLLRNREIYPSFPFSQWWNKPSEIYRKYNDKQKWPNFSGYLEGRKNSEYSGDFRLRPEISSL